MPAISDPGYKLIRRCIERDLDVTVLPGPSVVPVALVASGLPTDRWRFEGFLPKRSGEMERVLRSAETVVAFESPRRVGESLAALAAIAPDRPAAVCRELTKMHEEVARGSLAELARRFRGDVKGEIVLVIGPAAAEDHDRDVGFAVDALRHLVQSGARPRAAASVVAALTGTRANDLYRALTGREPRSDDRLALRRRSDPTTSPPRSTTSTRSRTSATPTRRWPPTCSLATCASAARTSSSSPAPTSMASRSRRRPSARGSRRRSWPTATRPSSRRWCRSSARPTTSSSAPPIRATRTKVAEIMQRVYDNGWVNKGTYEGWYCPRCADFKTERELGPGNTCPIHEIPLEKVREENWFFRLSAFQEPARRPL